MPSNRKRIGFLPSKEVQEIIEEICQKNKYSQSKLTGLLVEEALRSRGILKTQLVDYIIDRGLDQRNSKIKKNIPLNIDLNTNIDISHINKKNLREELKIINEYIEFKLFKKVMNENSDILNN